MKIKGSSEPENIKKYITGETFINQFFCIKIFTQFSVNFSFFGILNLFIFLS